MTEKLQVTLDDIKSGPQPQPVRTLIYGTDGIGKSSFAASAPNSLVLDLEGGLSEIDAQSISLRSADYETVMDALRLVYQNLKALGITTVVVDSLDWLEKVIFKKVCSQYGKQSIDEIGYAKGYTYALTHWQHLLSALDMLREKGVAIVLIAHPQVVRVEDPLFDPYDRHDLKLDKRVRGVIKEWADVVAFCQYEIFTNKSSERFGESRYRATSTGRRVIHLREQPGYEAKSRLALPDSLPLDWSAYEAAINEARGNSAFASKQQPPA